MDYQQMYQNKLTTAASAANVIQSGDWVDYGWCRVFDTLFAP